jgi:hypothetical protein
MSGEPKSMLLPIASRLIKGRVAFPWQPQLEQIISDEKVGRHLRGRSIAQRNNQEHHLINYVDTQLIKERTLKTTLSIY